MSDIFADTEEPRRRLPGFGCLVGLVVLALVVALGAFAYTKGVDLLKRALSSPPERTCSSPHGNGRIVQVEAGDTWTDAAKTLCKQGIISDYSTFIDAANTESRSLQPGSYRVPAVMSAPAALNLLANPDKRVFTPVTIPEGYRAEEALKVIVDKSRFSQQQVRHAYSKLEGSGLPAYAKGNAEGYLFPSTYNVEPGITAGDLLRQMVAQFDQYASAAHLPSRAAELGRTPAEVVTVASLVQAEARRPQDMPKVAAVIYNRLDKGMPLQLDSTLHYVEQSRGVVYTTPELRKLDSPYNTYRVVGLPPTPIDLPGADALDAALNPTDASYLYFVTVNLRTGETRFATSYVDHLRNVALYEQYCQTSDEC